MKTVLNRKDGSKKVVPGKTHKRRPNNRWKMMESGYVRPMLKEMRQACAELPLFGGVEMTQLELAQGITAYRQALPVDHPGYLEPGRVIEQTAVSAYERGVNNNMNTYTLAGAMWYFWRVGLFRDPRECAKWWEWKFTMPQGSLEPNLDDLVPN